MGRLKPTLILGGPGCGKTTALLEIVEKALARGVPPDRIAFVAFTRKAAQEARDRMGKKFGIEPDKIPYFKTLHSFAFGQLDVDRTQILDDAKLVEYARAEGLDLTPEYVDEFGMTVPQASTLDERILNAIALSRLTQRPLEDIAGDEGLEFALVKKIHDDYQAFKNDAFLVDFTDMIENFVEQATIPTFDLLIVDEAQDLSHLQWRMVERLVEHSKDVYFAGDDDQAIYAWAGADIEYFLRMDADRVILPTSYRLKRDVFLACQRVIRMVDDRYEKDWQPHAEGGVIDYVGRLEHLDLSQGTWYLLARTNSLVRRFTKFLQEEGYPYWTPTKHGLRSSVSVDPVQAVLVYENLKQGKTFNGERMRLVWSYIRPKLLPAATPVFDAHSEYSIADLCSTGFDATPSWLDALSIAGGMQAYIRAMRARGESLVKPPRITASTIHGVKGGEAENVVVDQKLTTRTFTSWTNCDPQEVRALFTAMSRASERLIFLDARTAQNYGVERILS